MMLIVEESYFIEEWTHVVKFVVAKQYTPRGKLGTCACHDLAFFRLKKFDLNENRQKSKENKIKHKNSVNFKSN